MPRTLNDLEAAARAQQRVLAALVGQQKRGTPLPETVDDDVQMAKELIDGTSLAKPIDAAFVVHSTSGGPTSNET